MYDVLENIDESHDVLFSSKQLVMPEDGSSLLLGKYTEKALIRCQSFFTKAGFGSQEFPSSTCGCLCSPWSYCNPVFWGAQQALDSAPEISHWHCSSGFWESLHARPILEHTTSVIFCEIWQLICELFSSPTNSGWGSMLMPLSSNGYHAGLHGDGVS